jgi:hypothetical protein
MRDSRKMLIFPINTREHCCSSKGNFEISVGHLDSKISPELYTISPLVIITAYNLVALLFILPPLTAIKRWTKPFLLLVPLYLIGRTRF